MHIVLIILNHDVHSEKQMTRQQPAAVDFIMRDWHIYDKEEYDRHSTKEVKFEVRSLYVMLSSQQGSKILLYTVV